jgi:Flp pilus assembly protein TadD
MKTVLPLIALVAAICPGCGNEEVTPPPVVPTTSAPAPAPSPPIAQAPTPATPAKQLISITTKSPDARAALLRAWDLSDNNRDEEALALCKQAIAADPDFALGHTCVGNATPGAAGQAELDKGVDLAASLPDAERLFAEAFAAARHQDMAKAIADLRRVADLAPDDVHARSWLGYTSLFQRDFAGAEASFKKVLELNPAAAFVYGPLSWTHTQLGEYEDALTTARKYAEASPNEPGAHQAVGIALLRLGQLKEADTELAKAVELGPKSRPFYYDLASVKALEGDFTGARDTLDRSKMAETVPSQMLERASRTAWVLLAQNKNAEATALLDATEKDSDAQKLVWPATEASTRAWSAWVLGKPADALKAATAGMARCDRPESSTAYKADCRRDMLTIQALAQIAAKKPADAQKTVATLRDESKNWQGNGWVQVEIEMLGDLTSKDAKGAAAALAKCPPDDFLFKLGILRQAEGSGDKATADQARTGVLARPLTDAQYPLVARVVKTKK